jgi:hypothetical protein
MLGRPAPSRLAAAVITPLALMAMALVANRVWPQTMDGRASPASAVVCAAFTLLFACGPLAAFAFLARGSEAVTPRIAGAALGSAAGAWGALGIELYCVRCIPSHVLAGHVAPVVLLALLGVLLGQGVLRLCASKTVANEEHRRG